MHIALQFMHRKRNKSMRQLRRARVESLANQQLIRMGAVTEAVAFALHATVDATK